MKKYAVLSLAMLALVALPLNAQSIYVGAGAAFPTGDDMDGVDTGLNLAGGVTFDVASRVSIYGEGSWGTHGTDFEGVDAKPYALMAGLLLNLGSGGEGALSPYIFGGGGMQWLKLTDGDTDVSDSAFGLQLGAGVDFPLGGLNGFAEGRYHRASFDADSDLGDFSFATFGLLVGLSFDVGGN